MEKLISNAKYSTDHVSRELLESLEARERDLGINDAVFYYDFPSFRDYEDDAYRPNAMLLSPLHGVIALNVCDAAPAEKVVAGPIVAADENLSQFFSILFGRLIKSRLLRRSRNTLAFSFAGLIYAPGFRVDRFSGYDQLENEVVTSFEAFSDWLEEHRAERIETDLFLEARSIIEGAKALNRPKPRDIPLDRDMPKAHILAALEAEIANFDADQRKAAITVLNGPQRIRGLAGTGKTIVLAMKAAQLHLNEPTRRVLYTFYTKSLYDLIKRLITRFYRHYKDSDPDWERVRILHAWGGATVEGVYHTACIENGVSPLRWKDVRPAVGEPFDYVCKELLKNSVKTAYDSVLIDEGQDLPEHFFRLCFHLTTGDRDEKNLIWAYDELQNIFDVKVRSPRELFGTDEEGEPLVDLERASAALPPYLSNDSVLYKSYRNPKEVLISAHALGFGLYSAQIVQMLENRAHWEDVGYEVEAGEFVTGSRTVIVRPDENSPLSLSKREKKENIVRFHSAGDYPGEVGWIVGEIKAFIADGLRPEEILVISLDDRNARHYFEQIKSELLETGIRCNNVLDNPFTSSHFAIENKVTLSTVHRAKGNEAAAVFTVGIDALYQFRNSRTGRNRIFTAFTRAKAWLRVSGIGDSADFFLRELGIAFEKCPKLEFTFPDLRQVDLLQRDISKRETKLKRLRDKYRKDLERLGLGEDDMAEFFAGEDKK